MVQFTRYLLQFVSGNNAQNYKFLKQHAIVLLIVKYNILFVTSYFAMVPVLYFNFKCQLMQIWNAQVEKLIISNFIFYIVLQYSHYI